LVPGFFSAASTLALRGMDLPPRTPSSAVMTSLLSQSAMRASDRFGREAAEDDRMHRADARAGEHRDGRLRDHRHVDGDAIAFLHARLASAFARRQVRACSSR
jgi:hypothetical protein